MKQVISRSEYSPELSDCLIRLIEFGPKLVLQSVENNLKAVKEVSNLVSHSLPKWELCLPKICLPCDIPETECPPHCVCDIEWRACRGQQLKATIQVRNTARVARPFTFTATPFQGPGNPNVAVDVAPPNAGLKPNQTVVVTVTFTVSPEFQADQFYYGEVLITGAYEQCVRLLLHIRPDVTPHCVVEQGEIPTRIRAHRWYDHFQCEEPCEEPVASKLGTVGTVPPYNFV
jgi:hypothetical protein